MSTENPIVANFDGLDGLERLAARFRLDVRPTLADDVQHLEPGALLRLPRHDIRRLAMSLWSDWHTDEIAPAVDEARLKAENVIVVVIAEDSFLKERLIIAGPTPIADFPDHLTLAAYGGDRPDGLRNTHRGYTIEADIALADELDLLSFRPHRRGTVLARSVFKIRSFADLDGLDPEPLTSEWCDELEVPARTLLYVHAGDELLPQATLASNLRIFVNETLLAALGHQRGADRDAILSGLAIEALEQIVFLVHAELRDDISFTWDGEGAAVLWLLKRNLAKAGLRLEPDDLVGLLRDSPSRAAAYMSGLDRRSARLLQVVSGDDDTTTSTGEEAP